MFVIITMWSWFVNCSGYRRFLVVAIGFSYNSYCRSFHFNFLQKIIPSINMLPLSDRNHLNTGDV